MEEISARLNALEPGVLERDAHIQHLNMMLQLSALQAQSSTTSVPLPDLHREMLARVKEFDGDVDKWLGWWFKLLSLLKANHLGYEGMIERIAQETDATDLINAVLSNADKKLSSSLYCVLGLTMTDEHVAQDSTQCGSWRRRNCSSQVAGGVPARHRQSSLGSADVHELVGWSDRSSHCNQRVGRINAYQLQSGERMADTANERFGTPS